MHSLQPLALVTDAAAVEMFAHGGHVARWQPRGQAPVLFVSRASRYQPGEPIRGGIPVIFPWFGDDPEGRGRSAHGFARRRLWQRVATGPNEVMYELQDDDATLALWPHRFALRLIVRFGAILEVALQVSNRDDRAWRYESALHTYLAVHDVRRVELQGLEGARFVDKAAGGVQAMQPAEPLRFTGETDRVFSRAPDTCVIDDPGLARRLVLTKSGAASTIVWNPWVEKASRMADLRDDEWPSMLCVESGNVGSDALDLPPGGTHEMSVRIEVTSRPR
ncbi:MAG: D-hexose-6-phosphate mutarotase [Planctomycetota bacterium]